MHLRVLDAALAFAFPPGTAAAFFASKVLLALAAAAVAFFVLPAAFFAAFFFAAVAPVFGSAPLFLFTDSAILFHNIICNVSYNSDI